MAMLRKIQNCIRLVGILAILGAVVLFPSASAHAGMTHGGMDDHQVDHLDHADQEHDSLPDGDIVPVGNSHSHDNGSNCCSGMCVSAVIMAHTPASSGFMRESHNSLPTITLSSASVPGFLRPPNL